MAENKISAKWYEHRLFVAYVLMSIVGSYFFMQQNSNVRSENADIKRENAEIKAQSQALKDSIAGVTHRFDVKDAKMYNAMKEMAKSAQEGYFEERRRNLLTLHEVKQRGCQLPTDLAVALPDRNFEPIENLLIQGNN